MSACKLFLGIAAPATLAADLARAVGLPEKDVSPLSPHITMQWCGPDISDADLATIKCVWEDDMRKAELDPKYDNVVTTTGKLALYGKDKDCLVALCEVSDRFAAMVASTCEHASVVLPTIPKSDFAFSPHITIGAATEIPDSAVLSIKTFAFDKITMWGDGADGVSEVRDTIAIPFADV